MISDKTKALGVVALTLALTGCLSSEGTDSNAPLIPDDDVILTNTTVTTTEITNTTDITDGVASPVSAVSSAQMDAFVDNPLLVSIPAEAEGEASNASSSSFITNPLMH